ncbi:MAG: aminoglycoside phosphotransferase family protein [Pseudomonadota bacterium]
MNVSSDDAIELVEPALGEGTWRCQLFGAGKFSQTFAVSSEDGRQFVLRIAPPDSVLHLFYEYRMMRQEPGIHRRLLKETSVPVPPILAYDFSRCLIDRDFLIMPRLAGVPLNTVTLNRIGSERAFREWGQYVAQIHTITDPDNRFGYLGDHNCMELQPSWRGAFNVMYRKELDDICSSGVYSRTQADDAIALLEDHLEVFESCQISTLCHGDLWVTNLLVQPDGEVTGVIDFDRACWGDIEWDMAIAEYCGITRPPFWEGYGRTVNTHSGDAAIRRLFYLLYEHQKYIIISMSSRRDDPGRARRYARECLTIMDQFRKTGWPQF